MFANAFSLTNASSCPTASCGDPADKSFRSAVATATSMDVAAVENLLVAIEVAPAGASRAPVACVDGRWTAGAMCLIRFRSNLEATFEL